MKMSDEKVLPAPREQVWQALNDTEVLKRAIPGCESLERLSATELKATVAVKIGPINARFSGDVSLSDLDPPNSYTITGKGKAGAAGMASGRARVALIEEQYPEGEGGGANAGGPATRLRYDVEANVSGRIAQLGGRLIDATAKKLADAFFANLAREFEGEEDEAPGEGAVAAARIQPRARGAWPLWLAAAVVLGLAALAYWFL